MTTFEKLRRLKKIMNEDDLTNSGYTGDIVPLIPGMLCHRKQM